MTKDNKLEVRKVIVSRFSALSRELLKATPEDKTKKRLFGRHEEECYTFQTLLEKEVNYLATAIPRVRTLVESCLKIYLAHYGVRTQDSFLDNETALKRYCKESDSDVLYHYVKTIRLGANKKIHQGKDGEYDDDESAALLFLTLNVLEKFYQGITSQVSTPEPKGGIKLEIENLDFSSNGNIVLVSERDHPSVCMENASGIPCYRHCKEHSSEKLVYMSFTTIGTVRCIFGMECKKNKKMLRMSNGQEVSVCQYLHGDQYDEVKRKIGQNWNAYVKNQIPFAEIVGNGAMRAETPFKVNLVNSQRCKFLPCMENACGVACYHRCAEHSDECNVYYSYTKIGSEKCEYGEACKKYQKVIHMKDGRDCNHCPFLHGDHIDTIKKRLGLGWSMYAQGVISYDQVFTDEDLTKSTKTALYQ